MAGEGVELNDGSLPLEDGVSGLWASPLSTQGYGQQDGEPYPKARPANIGPTLEERSAVRRKLAIRNECNLRRATATILESGYHRK